MAATIIIIGNSHCVGYLQAAGGLIVGLLSEHNNHMIAVESNMTAICQNNKLIYFFDRSRNIILVSIIDS